LVRSPLYTNDGETAANGPQKTQSDAPARYRERRWKKTKKRKKGMIKENTKEEQKKMISATSNRPSGYSFGTALTEVLVVVREAVLADALEDVLEDQLA